MIVRRTLAAGWSWRVLGILWLLAGASTLPVVAEEVEPDRLSGFQRDYLRELDTVAGKLVALARALPAERYGWRPTEEVRSVSEALVHLAWTNEALLAGIAGESPPRSRGVERTMRDKEEVVAYLEASLVEARRRVESLAPAELDREVEVFGGPTSTRFVLLRLLDHAHEHLGQMIVYSRLLGIAPPWSG